MRRTGLVILILALGQIPLSALAEDPPQFELKWGTDGKGAGQFDEVIGIAVSPDGFIYTTDRHRVQKFTSDGSYLLEWGSQGSGDGGFNSPRGCSFDASGNIYVADWGNARIQKFTALDLGPAETPVHPLT